MVGDGMGSAFLTPIVWLFCALVFAIPAMALLRACVVDGTMSLGSGVGSLLGMLCGAGFLMQNGGTGATLFLGIALILAGAGWPVVGFFADRKLHHKLRDDDIERYERAIVFDATNAGAHAGLAEKLATLARRDEAIHEYRTAVRLMPNGPQTTRWKSELRALLDEEAGIDRYDFKVCDSCHRDMAKKQSTCPHCDAVQSVNFFVWAARPENALPTLRYVIAISLIIIFLFTFLGAVPLQVAGIVIMLLLPGVGWLVLRVLSP